MSKKTQHVGEYGRKIGEENKRRVADFFRANPFATKLECAAALGLSPMAVGRHVKALKDEHSKRN